MKRIIILCIFLILMTCLFLSFKIKTKVFNENHQYDNYISMYSDRFNVDPLLIKAIIKKESNFNPNIVSNKGAVGLMQIMPKTALEIAKQLNVSDYSYIKIKEAKTNIMFGTYYIKKLLNYYSNNLFLALAAYNAGIGNVDNWYKNNQQIGKKIYEIPFKETRCYVRSIIIAHKIYVVTYTIKYQINSLLYIGGMKLRKILQR